MTKWTAEIDEARLLQDNLGLIQQLIDQVARRRGLAQEEREEFNSIAWLKLIESASTVFGGFRGDCEMRTYLFRVIDRILLDYRVSKWGKWRPSAHAKRSGWRTRQLERLLQRDRYTVREAVGILRTNYQWSLSSGQIVEMAQKLPNKLRRLRAGEEEVEQLADSAGSPEEVIQHLEREGSRDRVQALLRQAFFALRQPERQLLRMRFRDGLSVAEIARRTGKDQKRLYRIMARSLSRLRGFLESGGVCKEDLPQVVGCKSGEFRGCLTSGA